MNTPCPIPDDLAAKWEFHTQPTDDGHLHWTGKRYVIWRDHQYGPRIVAYTLHNKRLPIGAVRPECGHRGCILPSHVEDTPGRYRTRLAYRAVLGLPAPPEQCRRGHDQTIHGRLETDGEAYCSACAHPAKDPADMLRLHGERRMAAALALQARYDAGQSIRDLVAHTGRTYGYVHDLLAHAGTQFRPRGYHDAFHRRTA